MMKRCIFLLLGWFSITFLYSICVAEAKIIVPPNSTKEQVYQRVTGKEIRKMVQEYITKNVPAELDHIKIKNFKIYPDKDVVLSPGKLSCEVFAKRGSKFLGTTYFDIFFNIDDRLQKKIRAMAYLEAIEKVVVTRRPLGRRQLITPNDIISKEMNLAELPNNVIFDPSQAIGKRTKAVIDPYTPLTTDILELPPLVKRRKLVRIVAETDVLRITTLGQARQDGRKGEVIKVRNISSNKEIYGRVIDANTIKIELY
jgi:flagella basal body P-ring formation protein FlgA